MTRILNLRRATARRHVVALIVGFGLLTTSACEDGPEQIYTPVNDKLPTRAGETWTQEGERGFGAGTSGDRTGRARFCDEAETTDLIAQLVQEPIVPDVSLGGIPMWSPEGEALSADDLLGRIEDGGFCDPTQVFADAFVWGPTQEIIVFFNQETRLVESLIATQTYLGSLEGTANVGGEEIEVVIQPRERVSLNGRELDQYTSRADQGSRTNAWLNDVNATAIYAMVRQTFFDEGPLPADFNCVDAALCDIIYTASDESVPQDTFLVLQDSGIQLRFTPDGYIIFVFTEPVRVAPFEVIGELSMGDGTTLAPAFTSGSKEGCTVDVSSGMTWGDFRANCVELERTLNRVNYDVYTQRDAVTVQFNGLDLDFLRPTSTAGVFEDGEAPAESDELFAMTFTRSLQAPLAQFVPAELGAAYKVALEAQVRAAVSPDAAPDHPFLTWELAVPDTLAPVPQRIGELTYLSPRGPASWIPDVLAEVDALYQSLSPELRAQVSDDLLDPVYLIEPFTSVVIDAFSFGATTSPEAHKVFRTTDDERWSIGYGHFVAADGKAYRITVQYSLNFGAVTAVTVSQGYSELDTVINDVNTAVREALGAPPSPFYVAVLANPGFEMNPYRLGGDGITVNGFDRALGTLDVTLTTMTPGAEGSLDLTVPGTPITDRGGFLRQIRGERFEFVPAHQVVLYGKETAQVVHVLEDGTIGRLEVLQFKGAVELCPGLLVGYGDNVPEALEAWRGAVDVETYRTCELVSNYSEDGSILLSVASLNNRIEFDVVAGRAVNVAMWQ